MTTITSLTKYNPRIEDQCSISLQTSGDELYPQKWVRCDHGHTYRLGSLRQAIIETGREICFVCTRPLDERSIAMLQLPERIAPATEDQIPEAREAILPPLGDIAIKKLKCFGAIMFTTMTVEAAVARVGGLYPMVGQTIGAIGGLVLSYGLNQILS